MKLLQKKGFTLIELLVVITIIGILATGGVAIYTSQIQKARDTTRIGDIKVIQSGVEQNYQDAGEYPLDAATATGIISKYAQGGKVPADAKTTQPCSGSTATKPLCDYGYAAGNLNGITNAGYEVSSAFENDANRTNKAANTKDGGNDDDRYEIGNMLTLSTGSGTTIIK